MAKSITQFLPNYETKERRIQADIGASLALAADKIRKERKLTWAEIMTALLEKFVDDLGPKASPEGSFKLKKMELDPQLSMNQSFWK